MRENLATRRLPFFKMHGGGNDFVLLDHREGIIPETEQSRFAQRVCAPKVGVGADGLILIENSEVADLRWQFYNADGNTGVEGTNGSESIWCAYTAKANGKIVTIAMFSHPDNEHHPATWFTLDKGFAYLSLTMNLDKQPVKIVFGKPLVVRYAVALLDGRVEADKINQLYDRWIAKLKTPTKE